MLTVEAEWICIRSSDKCFWYFRIPPKLKPPNYLICCIYIKNQLNLKNEIDRGFVCFLLIPFSLFYSLKHRTEWRWSGLFDLFRLSQAIKIMFTTCQNFHINSIHSTQRWDKQNSSTFLDDRWRKFFLIFVWQAELQFVNFFLTSSFYCWANIRNYIVINWKPKKLYNCVITNNLSKTHIFMEATGRRNFYLH